MATRRSTDDAPGAVAETGTNKSSGVPAQDASANANSSSNVLSITVGITLGLQVDWIKTVPTTAPNDPIAHRPRGGDCQPKSTGASRPDNAKARSLTFSSRNSKRNKHAALKLRRKL